ncbi:hypothetical protein ILUMI_21165 [Ignelater luminosus]|uniref:Uncharacterized protein n=1 Tax=Ignelater luminosus TaxID=2038154 RepID=A0A8K0CG28_IGNLU|nr:hypothetical protein ILUMI_21165 [Ignelater luminosus]
MAREMDFTSVLSGRQLVASAEIVLTNSERIDSQSSDVNDIFTLPTMSEFFTWIEGNLDSNHRKSFPVQVFGNNMPWNYYFDNLLVFLKYNGYTETGTMREDRVPKSCPLNKKQLLCDQLEFRREIVQTCLIRYGVSPKGAGRPSTSRNSITLNRVSDDTDYDKMDYLLIRVPENEKQRSAGEGCPSIDRTMCKKCDVVCKQKVK